MFNRFSLNLHGRLYVADRPQVMGILNITPDSFYSGSRTMRDREIAARIISMVEEGADMIDIGAYSSRPGAADVPLEEEIDRLRLGMRLLRDIAPEIPVSVDTFRAGVARVAVEELGADIVNDISGGDLDPEMWSAVAALGVPYILMHMRGTPSTMQQFVDYGDVTADVINDLSRKLRGLRLSGVADVIVDPGFGFSKTIDQNFEMMRNLRAFTLALDAPLLVGISRKSMIYKTFDTDPAETLNGTTVLNTIAISRGASILRVHDVKQCVEAVRLSLLSSN
ncbi:MAG: dihydropteroate synthase [Duncaniella sp.]|nr:dihydropteroate synthase [Duncaniella sp.]